MQELVRMAIDTLNQHLTGGYAWTPQLAFGAVILGGLVLLWRGAWLATALCAAVFAGLGGTAGAAVSTHLDVALLPSLALGGIIGLFAGILLAQLWVALLLAGCFAAAGLGVYSARMLPPHLDSYFRGDDMSHISLPAPGQYVADTGQVTTSELWAHLQSNVPNLQGSLIAIAATTALAGLVCGLLLPGLARAIVASTAGTAAIVAGTLGLLHMSGREAWVTGQGSWPWIVVGVIWAGGLLRNLFRRRVLPPPPPAAARVAPSASKTAAATA